jgi:ParB/RepB/Spo0J family partition protein
MATATVTKKGKAGKAAAVEAPAVEIPSERAATSSDLRVLKVADIRIEDKHDRDGERDTEAFKAGIEELAASIASTGLIQPISVCFVEKGATKYPLLISGERRILAHRLAKIGDIPAIIQAPGVDVRRARAAENIHRKDMDEDAKVLSIADMISGEVEAVCKEQGVKAFSDLDAPAQDAINCLAQQRVARDFGWTLSKVQACAFAAEMPAEVLSLYRSHRLTMDHLRVLATLPDEAQIVRLARAHAGGVDPVLEPVRPLRELKRDVAKETCRLAGVPWNQEVAFGPKDRSGKPRACATCPDNSNNRSGLFDGKNLKPESTSQFDQSNKYGVSERDIAGGMCSNLKCYREKVKLSKGAWRGSADRIAAKVVATKPAERKTLLTKLVREAANRCTFIPITVFGSLATARVKSKVDMARPAGKKKPSSAQRESRSSDDWQRKWELENKHRDAVQRWSNTIEKPVLQIIAGWEPERAAMIALAVDWTPLGRRVSGHRHGGPKQADIASFKALCATIATKPLDQVKAAVLKLRPDDQKPTRDFYENALVAVAEAFGVKDIAPIPALKDFLAELKKPKPAASTKAKPAKKGKAKKAAKVKAAAIEPDAEGDDASEEE